MRPDCPSKNVVDLSGDELEQLIEEEQTVQHSAMADGASGVERVKDVETAKDAPLPSPHPPQPDLRTRSGRAREGSEPRARGSAGSGGDAHAARTPSARRRGSAPSAPGTATGDSSLPLDPTRRSAPHGEDAVDDMLGRTLGSYRIHSLLGEGGMGKVYLAEHVKLGRRVALKLLREEYASKRDAVARFFTEAQAVNTIRHENIVDITDFVELPSGETFIIMELLEGQDLGELQRQDGKPIPLHRAMGIALQVCDALEAAHQVGVVHRDLKPDNVFVVNSATRRDFVKLLDFGVAKLLRDPTPADRWQTVAGSVIGTPAYMSPEQASGIPVDNRSDIYSLGAILYELFTGHPVFRAKSFGEYVVKHMNDEPIPPRDLKDAPRLPVALEQLILRCLEKDPDRRYQAVAELRDDLARATATIQAHVALGGTMDRRSYRRLFMWGLIVVGVTALAAAAFWLASGLSVEDVAREPSPGGSSATSGATPESEPVSPSKVVTARLTLVTDPKGAEVFRKGETASLGRTPLDLRLPNVGEDVEFLFRLEGYEEAVERVTVADNALFSVPLIPKKRPGAAVSPAPADKPAAQKQRRPKGRGGSVSKGVIRSADHPSEPRTKIKKRPAPINPEEVVDPFAQ